MDILSKREKCVAGDSESLPYNQIGIYVSTRWYIRYTGYTIRDNSTEAHIARWIVVRCSMLVARYCFTPSLARCSIWSAKPTTHHLLPLPAIRKMPVAWVNCQVFDVTADSWVSPSDWHTIKSEDTNPYYAIPICTCKWT